jgi:uncharacterized repeat protein (TIGR01451 family)
MLTFRRSCIAVLLAVVAALSIVQATATAKPKPPQPPPLPEWQIDPATESDPVFKKMLQYRDWYRTTFRISPGSNVAVFHFKYPNGAEGYWAIHSDPTKNTDAKPTGHSERRAERIMRSLGIDKNSVTEILSELETCNLPGRKCKTMVAREFKHAKVGHLNPYPDDPAVRKESMKAHKATNRAYVRQYDQARQVMNPGGRQGGGSLPRALAAPRLGGIDFSSLELRYVSDKPGPDGRDLGYAFRAPSSATPGDPATGLETARQSSDAFFTWLALPPQSFWVNLNPSEPDRIIDPQLARTDVGRVLLDADMALKRSAVNLTRPDTTLGDQFWDELERLYGDRALEACWSARVWIVPEPASVRDTDDELYILDAPLTVKMVPEEIVDPAVGRPGCPAEPPPVEAAKAELFQRLILPHMINAVNTAPEYAALRRVYLARVAAEWFRQRSGEHPTAVTPIANSGDVTPWLARTPWNPMDVFNEMLTSTRNGEWTVERDVPSGGQVYKRTLIYGGVDFSQTPRQNVSRADFKSRYPRLAKQARQAQVEATPDTDQGQTWIGGGDDRPPITSASGAPLDQAAVGLGIHGPRRVHAGRLVRYRLRVSNVTPAAVRGVQVCDELSSELVFVRANRKRQVRDGRSCWRIARIASERSTDIRVTARVLDGARGSMRDTATVSMLGRPDVARVRQQRTFRVQTGGGGAQPAPTPRPGGVTG